jgi:hypothetical protein
MLQEVDKPFAINNKIVVVTFGNNHSCCFYTMKNKIKIEDIIHAM